MRLIADQDVYQVTVEFLRSIGHDVLQAKDAGLSSPSDLALLEHAHRDHRVLVTRDKGYGALAFRQGSGHEGIVLLRVSPATLQAVHNELHRFFSEHRAMDMRGCFVVIEPGRHRIRRTKA
jgi:predicted nuclease of predicted toxin-antitoxin system